MKCYKCDKELEKDSKFCPNCGKEISKEKSTYELAHEGMEMQMKIGYLFGFVRGNCLGDKKKEETLKWFEDKIAETGLKDEYQKVVDFWQDKFKEKDNEKDKATNGLK
jgi:hypothetical protein